MGYTLTMSSKPTPPIDERYPRRAFLDYDRIIAGQDTEEGQGDLDTELTFGEWRDAE